MCRTQSNKIQDTDERITNDNNHQPELTQVCEILLRNNLTETPWMWIRNL